MFFDSVVVCIANNQPRKKFFFFCNALPRDMFLVHGKKDDDISCLAINLQKVSRKGLRSISSIGCTGGNDLVNTKLERLYRRQILEQLGDNDKGKWLCRVEP